MLSFLVGLMIGIISGIIIMLLKPDSIILEVDDDGQI